MTGPALAWRTVPLRTVLVLVASGGLHWGAWQAIGGPVGRAASEAPVTAAVTPTPMPMPMMTWVVHGVAGVPTPTVRAGGPQARGPVQGGAGPRGIGALPPVRTAAPAQAAPGIAWFEVWEVDEPPQFLVAPEDLEGLARHVGRALRARVSLRIGTDGWPAGLQLDVDDVDPATRATLLEALETAFAPLAFLPGRRDGRPVPVVLRWELALDPAVPVALGMAPVN